jgi:hypothetical protein
VALMTVGGWHGLRCVRPCGRSCLARCGRLTHGRTARAVHTLRGRRMALTGVCVPSRRGPAHAEAAVNFTDALERSMGVAPDLVCGGDVLDAAALREWLYGRSVQVDLDLKQHQVTPTRC